MSPQENLDSIQAILRIIPAEVFKYIFIVIISNFAVLGAAAWHILKKIIDYRILLMDVAAIKEQLKLMNSDLNIAHNKIRDLEVGFKIKTG